MRIDERAEKLSEKVYETLIFVTQGSQKTIEFQNSELLLYLFKQENMLLEQNMHISLGPSSAILI